MKRIVIGGIGNVLLGDDGVGPYVVSLLERRHRWPQHVELVDLGTPSLDLVEYFAGAETVILVDAVQNGAAPGTITRYGRDDVLRHAPAPRLDPHSPALSETLLAAEMLGATPPTFLLVGISPSDLGGGASLSAPVLEAAERVVEMVLAEVRKAGAAPEPLALGGSDASPLWSASPAR